MFELIITKDELDIRKILNSGQVFRYECLDDGCMVLIFRKHFVKVKESRSGYIFYCSEEVFKSIWSGYLDLNRNYGEIKDGIIKKDKRLKAVVYEFNGIRILKQDPFEMLITFIISQSKSMVQIRKLVNMLSQTYGTFIGEEEGRSLYSFPEPMELSGLFEEDFRKMKFGYRAPYLVDAISTMNETPISNELNNESLLARLTDIKGVGDKVAACIMLYGYGRHNTFPVDTWIRKIMLHLYEKQIRKGLKNPKVKSVNNKHIEAFGLEKFKGNSGMAQQFLFEYGRRVL